MAIAAGCRTAPAALPDRPPAPAGAVPAATAATASVALSAPPPAASTASSVPLPSGEVCDDAGATVDVLGSGGAAGMPTVPIPGLGGAGAIATSSIVRATEAPSGPTPTPGPTLPPGAFARPRVAVEAFEAQPAEAAPGGRVTLAWRAVGEAATLHQLTDPGRLSDPTPVALSGTLEAVVPDAERDRMRWVLMVRAGDTRTSAEVAVTLTCPFTWFFPDPPSDCPAGAAEAGAMAVQRFERGWMVWSERRGTVDVLFDEGGRWSAYSDAWAAPTPESDPSLIPPAGRRQPVRGFGRVWRDEPGVRDGLGWATAPEVGIAEGRYQCDTNPQPVCYVPGLDGAVFALQRGTWWTWEGLPSP